ncbi:MAG: hypothetical protein KDD64_14710 [Bdellovibrionales bacterium]|nr:hypothetical protein [Bdellovibrionales bacterium]
MKRPSGIFMLVLMVGASFPLSSAVAEAEVYEVEKIISYYDVESGEWRSVEATDCFSLQKDGEGAFRMSLRLIQQNGHTCNLDGAVRETDSGYEYRYSFSSQEAACVLQVAKMEDRFRLEDVNGNCRNMFCGARGYFSGVEIPFASLQKVRAGQKGCELSSSDSEE